MNLPDFVENFVNIDFEELINEAIEDNEAELIDSLQDQLQHGFDQSGSRIGEYSTKEYATIKTQMNPLAGFGNIDLKLEGDFYRDMFLEKIEKDFQIRSSDYKNDKLERQYGKEIFGLMDENLGKVSQDYVLESLLEKIRKELDV